MKKLHTHYDNLQVARNASPEVIRAAYRMSSQKFHPDRNPENPESTKIMSIINEAYAVLSDPQKRREHDAWITRQESASSRVDSERSTPTPAPPRKEMPTDRNQGLGTFQRVLSHAAQYWALYAIAAFFIWVWAADEHKEPAPGPKPYVSAPPEKPAYIRPTTTPSGKPWPVQAGYIDGYKKLHTDGLSTVTINNSQNDSDVFVKLVSIDGASAYPVRQFYVPAHGSFTLNKVRAGTYDIRYRDLDTGQLSRSDPMSVEEHSTYEGTQFSNVTMTLYKVRNGNMETHPLSETEF